MVQHDSSASLPILPSAGCCLSAARRRQFRQRSRDLTATSRLAPANRINPAVIAAMAEWSIDLGREFPKPLTDEVVQAADAVITVGCGNACPIYPGKRYEDWELDDPAGKLVEVVRVIRDDLDGACPSPPRRARPSRRLNLSSAGLRPARVGASVCGCPQASMRAQSCRGGGGRRRPRRCAGSNGRSACDATTFAVRRSDGELVLVLPSVLWPAKQSHLLRFAPGAPGPSPPSADAE
jgi:arsenate reductase (thioredoxin)